MIVKWREYATGHSVVADEVRDISNWLKQVSSKDAVK
jgi:predicted esterase